MQDVESVRFFHKLWQGPTHMINENLRQRNVPDSGWKIRDLSALGVPTMRTHHAPYSNAEVSRSSPDPFHTTQSSGIRKPNQISNYNIMLHKLPESFPSQTVH